MNSRIEQIIEEIEGYIAECKPKMFSDSEIIVNRDELEELLSELKSKTPEEIRRYQKIISNQEAILADARQKADAIIAQAQVQTDKLVSEHQIMQQAYAQANEVVMLATKQAQDILDKATTDANEIREGAISYTDNLLRGMEETMSHAIETSNVRQQAFVTGLQQYLDVVTANRAELRPQNLLEPDDIPAPTPAATPAPATAPKEVKTELATPLTKNPDHGERHAAAHHKKAEEPAKSSGKGGTNLVLPEGMDNADPEILEKVQKTMEKAFGKDS